MSYIVVVDWSSVFAVTKYQPFELLEDADTFLVGVLPTYPRAFVTPHPGGASPEYWLVDPSMKTVTWREVEDTLANNLKEWTRKVEENEANLPQYAEDLFDSMDPVQLGRVNARTIEALQAKKDLIAARPVGDI